MLVTAQENDTVDLICWRYFDTTAGITEQVLAINPHIDSRSPILEMGTLVSLPDAYTPVQKTINLWD